MNNSSGSMPSTFRPLLEVLQIPRVAAVTVFLLILEVFILVGNFLVLWTIYKIQRMRYSAFYFVASLAVADFLIGLLVLPVSLGYHLTYEMNGQWIFGSFVCKAWLLANFWFCSASVLNLSLISWDRYVAMTSSLRYQTLMSEERVFRKICFSWCISFCLAVVLVTGTRNKAEPNATCTVLGSTTVHTILGAVVAFFIPVILLIFVNVTIWVIARRHQNRLHVLNVQSLQVTCARDAQCHTTGKKNKNNTKTNTLATSNRVTNVARAEVECKVETIASSQAIEKDTNSSIRKHNSQTARASDEFNSDTYTNKESSHTKTSKSDFTNKKRAGFSLTRTIKQEGKIFKTFLIIIGTFIVCWTPFYVVLLMNLVREVSTLLFYLTIILTYCNSAVNVFIYAVFSQEFRRALFESLSS